MAYQISWGLSGLKALIEEGGIETCVDGTIAHVGEKPAQQFGSGVVLIVEAHAQVGNLELEHHVVNEVCQVRVGVWGIGRGPCVQPRTQAVGGHGDGAEAIPGGHGAGMGMQRALPPSGPDVPQGLGQGHVPGGPARVDQAGGDGSSSMWARPVTSRRMMRGTR